MGAVRTTMTGGQVRSVLSRADAILDAFDGEHLSLTLTGLVARTGLPKTTVFRISEEMIGAIGFDTREFDDLKAKLRLLTERVSSPPAGA